MRKIAGSVSGRKCTAASTPAARPTGRSGTRYGFPVRPWIFPGNTVDVTPIAQVKKDLQGWQLTRCVFVGDAGMVSKENLHTLGLGGGKYILCMTILRGSEVAT